MEAGHVSIEGSLDAPVLVLVTLGCLFLSVVLIEAVGRRVALPRVTLLMCLGIAIGRDGLNLLPAPAYDLFEPVATIALAMVGFLMGGSLTPARLQRSGRLVLWISIGASIVTSLVVVAILLALGSVLTLALLLGGIAAATAPASTADVLNESPGDQDFKDLLMGVVALDDAWGLIAFSLLAALALMLSGNGDAVSVLGFAAWEIGGGVMLGALLGFPAAAISGRLEPGQPTRFEALGIVFVCAGMALMLGVSFLIAAIVMGAVVASVASHHEYAFHEIEGFEGPFLILFFVLAGASLPFESIRENGLLLLASYIGARLLGKFLGGWVGAWAGGGGVGTRRWVGLAMTPQAGVAIGLALLASERFPEVAAVLLPTVMAATIFFELVGPVLTRYSLKKLNAGQEA